MNYIAYTIGPIYETILDTLNDDNKTKKLKAGSYFFSLFMKTLLKNIQNDFTVLVPYIESEALTKEYKNMGLFHDRFIAQSEMSKEDIKAVFEQRVQTTFQELAKMIESESIADTLQQNMDNHHIVASEVELKSINENIIFALNQILDSIEVQRDFAYDKETSHIKQYQEKMVAKLENVKNLELLSGDFNYYAVITADGDKMREKIKDEATQNPENIKKLSKKLYEFFTAQDDIYTITNKQFGGELIYAGGDDILAFVPVKYKEKTFLDYIAVLDKKFKDTVGYDVSLSFGVNIAFYKYPLRDAVKSSFELLYNAKNNGQNSLAIKITKHSGQYFSSTLSMQDDKYIAYEQLVDDVLKETITLPHSIHHSLKRYEEAIIASFSNTNSSLDAMFETVFNDNDNDIKNEKDTKGLNDLKEYIRAAHPSSNEQFDDIFSKLSIIKFLREDRK